MDKDEKAIKEHLTRLIENLGRTLPDSSRVIEHLWKFAKMHDRRAYQLTRFCMGPENDYRTVFKAIVRLFQCIHPADAVLTWRRKSSPSESNNRQQLPRIFSIAYYPYCTASA